MVVVSVIVAMTVLVVLPMVVLVVVAAVVLVLFDRGHLFLLASFPSRCVLVARTVALVNTFTPVLTSIFDILSHEACTIASFGSQIATRDAVRSTVNWLRVVPTILISYPWIWFMRVSLPNGASGPARQWPCHELQR